MIGELIAAASLLGGGRLLDEFATKRFRVGALQIFRSSRQLDWRKFTSSQAWRLYTSIYGAKASSRRFIFRSLVGYFLLLFLGILFVYLYFEHTYLAITSVFRIGSWPEMAGWTSVIVGGSALYVLANAQTLYFLELLKVAPTTFRFFLVAYADFLITASIALFGTPFLLSIYTSIAIVSAHGRADVTFNFENSVRSPQADFLRGFGASLDPRILQRIIESQGQVFYLTYSYTVNNQDNQTDAKDFDLTRRFIEQGGLDGLEYHQRTRTIRTLDSSGSVLGFRERDRGFSNSAAVIETLQPGTNVEQRRRAFCRELSSGRSADIPYNIYNIDPMSRRSLYSACIHQTQVSVPIEFRLNLDNVDLGGVYRLFLFTNLMDLTRNLFHPMSSYLLVSPYRPFEPESGSGWWHQHRIGEQSDRSVVQFDETLLSAAFSHLGGYNSVLNKSAPAGTINFAIMSTALFNLLVLGFLFLFYPAAWLLRNTRLLNRFLTISRRPFTYIGGILAIYSSILSVLFAG